MSEINREATLPVGGERSVAYSADDRDCLIANPADHRGAVHVTYNQGGQRHFFNAAGWSPAVLREWCERVIDLCDRVEAGPVLTLEQRVERLEARLEASDA